jgi:acyl carrier protein
MKTLTQEDKEKIKEIISFQLDIVPEEIQDESTFKDLGMDSIDELELFFEIEKTFDCNISEQLQNDATIVSDIYDCLSYSL